MQVDIYKDISSNLINFHIINNMLIKVKINDVSRTNN